MEMDIGSRLIRLEMNFPADYMRFKSGTVESTRISAMRTANLAFASIILK